MQSKQTPSAQTSGYTEYINQPIIFNGFLFPRFPSLFYFADGQPERRCLFISSENERYVVSFEKGMKCMDVTLPFETNIVKHISSECRIGNRYLHLLRTDPETRPGIGNYAFFHMKIPDKNGELHTLAGQITAKAEYQWPGEVEPILKDLLTGIAVCKTKGGG